MEAKFFIKGPKKSNQSSNLTSQRMVTESRFMTLLLFMVHSVTDYKITFKAPILKFSVIVLYDASNNWEKIIIFRNGELTKVRVQRLQLFIQIYPHLMKTCINTTHIGLSIIFLTTQKSAF